MFKRGQRNMEGMGKPKEAESLRKGEQCKPWTKYPNVNVGEIPRHFL
jgi:hypothetical protein